MELKLGLKWNYGTHDENFKINSVNGFYTYYRACAPFWDNLGEINPSYNITIKA